MRILIVDDSAMSRMMLEHSLKKWGYQAISTENIDAATQLILSKSINFVITDWVMPGGNGLDLCRRIRELNQPFYIYVILITSLQGSESLVEGMEAGADDFLHKPIQMDELLARIRAGERVVQLERALQKRNIELQELSDNLLAAQTVINMDLQLAERMQRELLPVCPSTLLGVVIDGLFCPSGHVSGDIYNFFCLDEHHIGFYTIDVAGHGVAAAMMSFTLSQILTPDLSRGNLLKNNLPEAPYYEVIPSSTVIEKLNYQFQANAVNSLYFTMIYGVVNTQSHTIDLCLAGHPNPIYLPEKGVAQFIGESSFPVGIIAIAEYESICLDYCHGDKLFFYSDGITECMNSDGEMFGTERLLMLVEETRQLPSNEILNLIEQQLIFWRGNNKFDDDISMLVLIMTDNIINTLEF